MAAHPACVLHAKYGDRFATLQRAFDAGDAADFERGLEELLRERERGLFVEIGRLSRDLDAALERFTVDSRIIDLAEKDVPDARQRLAHVLTMTDEAAHRTMDLVEGACPLAERTGAVAAALAPQLAEFRARHGASLAEAAPVLERLGHMLADAQADSTQLRANLGEVLLAQGYQDLTGQIIRGVMHLVEEVEHALGNLVRLSHGEEGASASRVRIADGARSGADHRSGFGPPVPGVAHGAVVSGQQDVDSLLSGLGL